MKPILARMLLVVSLVALGACGDDAGSADDNTDVTDAGGAGEEAPPEDGAVDNCSLVTSEEVTELAGDELVAGEDTPLGCPFTAPGATIADVRVIGVIAEGGAQAMAEQAFPNAAEIIPVEVGEDTVAVTDPSGGAVASIITASGDRVVELSVIFVDVPPDDPARIEEAATLAVTALERFGG